MVKLHVSKFQLVISKCEFKKTKTKIVNIGSNQNGKLNAIEAVKVLKSDSFSKSRKRMY